MYIAFIYVCVCVCNVHFICATYIITTPIQRKVKGHVMETSTRKKSSELLPSEAVCVYFSTNPFRKRHESMFPCALSKITWQKCFVANNTMVNSK